MLVMILFGYLLGLMTSEKQAEITVFYKSRLITNVPDSGVVPTLEKSIKKQEQLIASLNGQKYSPQSKDDSYQEHIPIRDLEQKSKKYTDASPVLIFPLLPASSVWCSGAKREHRLFGFM